MYSRPVASRLAPLRTCLLDDAANNIPPSRLRSELLRMRRRCNEAHMSFDIDGDGDVSQDDYALAKKYDDNGNGILEAHEQVVAREGIAKEFFRRHDRDVHLYGQRWRVKDPAANARALADNPEGFSAVLRALKRRERRLQMAGSAHVERVLTDDSAKVQIFCDAIDLRSRKDLLRRRAASLRRDCADRLDVAHRKRPVYVTLRTSLITNMAVENS